MKFSRGPAKLAFPRAEKCLISWPSLDFRSLAAWPSPDVTSGGSKLFRRCARCHPGCLVCVDPLYPSPGSVSPGRIDWLSARPESLVPALEGSRADFGGVFVQLLTNAAFVSHDDVLWDQTKTVEPLAFRRELNLKKFLTGGLP
ncbi:hypothetical protein CMUS01_14249 [Colletotrichum musicola]|uniref:Uncharacterized protein n=1 Tax=Colletotrichum musicola TaxID=2175873 RepID=A0A8H6J5J2_9PEZI|nr:hypothetical protein CMUS01_14249 [Colletotrichum musicola]